MRYLTWLSAWLSAVLLLSVGCSPIVAPAGTPPATAPPAASLTEVPVAMPSAAAGTNFAIVNTRVFDGEKVIPNATVVVQDGAIVAVGPDVETPAGAEIIDGSGQTLLPGLIDAHTHAFGPDVLRQALLFGVTTEMDMFMDHSQAAQLRQADREDGAVERAALFSAGTLATAPGGHGTQFGLDIPTLSTPDEATAFVDARVAEGSDYIKIIIENGQELGLNWPTLDLATVRALVDAAHEHDKLTLVHVQTLAAAQEALAAGADGLAHIFVDAVPDPVFVDQIASSGMFVIPTLTVFQHIGTDPVPAPDTTVLQDPQLAPYLTPTDEQLLVNAYSGFPDLSITNGQEAVRLLFAAGVPILAGTDAGNPGTVHGASIHRELELLTLSGLSPRDALAAATSVTADTFGLRDRGRIALGLRADLLLVNGDPTTSITATRDIAGVWKLGVRADRESYLAQLEAQRAAVTQQAEQFAQQDIVVISDFESGEPSVDFGSGWDITTDQPAGGNSTAEMTVVSDGADGSQQSLQVSGTVGDAVPFAWAGVSYYPNATPFAPFDLSTKPTLHFWAKGEGGPFRIQLFCTGVSQVPPEQHFDVTETWQEVEIDLSSFEGCNIAETQAIIVSAGSTPGEFTLQIDEVSLR